jgi:hypothetical protein
MVGILYSLLSITFLLSGCLLLYKLKTHLTLFYKKVNCKVYAATFILSFSLLIRAVLNLVKYFP